VGQKSRHSVTGSPSLTAKGSWPRFSEALDEEFVDALGQIATPLLVRTHTEEGRRPATITHLGRPAASQIGLRQCRLVFWQRVDQVVKLPAICVEGGERHGPVGEQLQVAVGLGCQDAEDGLGNDVVVVPVLVEGAVAVSGEDGGQALLTRCGCLSACATGSSGTR